MKVRRIDFAPDEWLGGTVELKPYDRGVYITICALIYSRGESIGMDLIRRHCGVHMTALKASIARLAACRKIDVDGASVSQARCARELFFADLRLKKWAENHPESFESKELTLARNAPVRARKERPKKKDNLKDSDLVPREAARPSAAEVAEIDRLIAETLQSVTVKNGSPYVGKRDLWLNNLAGFVSEAFDGDARMAAWQAIEDARSAGTREATPKHIRQTIDDIDKLFRASAASYAEAAE